MKLNAFRVPDLGSLMKRARASTPEAMPGPRHRVRRDHVHLSTVSWLATVSPVDTAGKDMHRLTSEHYRTGLAAYVLVFLRATAVSA